MKKVDIAVVGGGPAGLTAAIYLGRAEVNYVLIEAGMLGGQINNTELIENYPGFPEIEAWDLTNRFVEHAKKWGGEPLVKRVTSLLKNGEGIFELYSEEEKIVEALSVILATGCIPRELGVKGEREYRGKGVSYCAICDGAFFRGKEVCVIGGGDSAVEEAIGLSKLVKKVTIIHRRDQLRAVPVLQKRAFAVPNIDFIWDSVVEEISGDDLGVKKVMIKNKKTGEISEVPAEGVFIYIGQKPIADYLKLDVEKDERGFIKAKDNLETNVPGLFVAGDLRSKGVRQIANAVGEGATAANEAIKYLLHN